MLTRRRRSPRTHRPVHPDALTLGQAALYDLFVRLEKPARAYAAQWTTRDASEDLVQQAFLEIMDECFSGDDVPDGPMDALFFRILRNRCVDWQRGVRRMERAPDTQADSGVVELAVWVDHRNPAHVADGGMLAARVDYIIESMPPEMRRVMRAARDTGWDAARGIADATGLGLDVVRWHLKKGRERLRAQLEKDGYAVPSQLRAGRPAGFGSARGGSSGGGGGGGGGGRTS